MCQTVYKAAAFLCALCVSQPFSLEAGAATAVKSTLIWKIRSLPTIICECPPANPVSVADEGEKKPVSAAGGCAEFVKPPYCLAGGLVTKIKDAIAVWNKEFQFNITLAIATELPNGPYVLFRGANTPKECVSIGAGQYSDSANIIRIGSDCSRSGGTPIGSIVHEIGHRVGLYHEQQNPSRNDYIKIIQQSFLEDNLRVCELADLTKCGPDTRVKKTNQVKYTGDGYGEYDFKSIMHYSPGTAPNARFEATEKGIARYKAEGIKSFYTEVGQRIALSDGDIATIKLLYPQAPK